MTNIYDQLILSSNMFSANIFYADDKGTEVTYCEFVYLVHRNRCELQLLGAQDGDIILFSEYDSLSVLARMFACWSINCIVAFINPLTKCDDLKNLISFIKPKVAFIHGKTNTYSIYEKMTKQSNAALIAFTTGTSNKPKGIIHSHHGILINAKLIGKYLKLKSDDKCLNLKSLHHVASISSLIIPSLMAGAQVCFCSDANLYKITEYIYNTKITFIDVAATVLRYISFFTKKQQVNSPLRVISVNGEHLSAQELQMMNDLFPTTQIYYSYGLSEAGPRVTYLDTSLYPDKLGSVGHPLEEVIIKIRDTSKTDVTAVSSFQQCQIGEIMVRTPSIMLGYFKNKQLTIEAIEEGYLYTGDIGYIDVEGFLFVLGRKDDKIIRGGQNIYPYEIEDMIKTMPGITECVVDGIPDQENGSKVVAFVTVNSDISKYQVLRYCSEKLPRYLVPQEIIILKEFPRINGKLVRKQLKNVLKLQSFES